ncbi:MAG: rod shape-determining protein MreC [Acidobacteriaceae bacterium]
MESFFSRYRNALVLIVVLVAQLLALAIQAKRPRTDGADSPTVSLMRYTVVSVVTPPERLVHNTGQWFRSVWFGYIDLIHVRRQNTRLQEQIQHLRLDQASIAQDAAQGQRLQRMLGFKEHYINATMPAQVIGTSGTDQSQVIYIDKGSKDGLKQDMPVITANGIVGKLKDVFPYTSQVLLATDPTSGVGVILQNTRIRGILRGRAYGQLEVADVSPDSRIKAGEPIVTSGGDQIFPRGLPVGTVIRVIPDPEHDPLVDVLVRPAAGLSKLEEVLVITGMSDTMSSQEAKDLAESEAESEAEQQRASDVLAARLPSRIDPNAPADTNPEQLVNAAGDPIKPPAAPLPVHSDRFSPGAEPDAAQMIPGHRWAPVKYGTEDHPAPLQPRPTPQKPAVATTVASAAPRATAPVGSTATSLSVPKAPAQTSAAIRPPIVSDADSRASKIQLGKSRAIVDGSVTVPRRKAPAIPSAAAPKDHPTTHSAPAGQKSGSAPVAAPQGGTR